MSETGSYSGVYQHLSQNGDNQLFKPKDAFDGSESLSLKLATAFTTSIKFYLFNRFRDVELIGLL